MQRSFPNSLSTGQLFITLFASCLLALVAFGVSAWTGPTAAAPGGNVAAPVNVGATAQAKAGSLALGTQNAPQGQLDVYGTAFADLGAFGNALVAGTGSGGTGYLNFNTTQGEPGYGFRDSSGAMQYKDSGGAWTPFSSLTGGGGGGESIDWANPQTYQASGSSNIVKNIGTHKLCVVSTSGDSGCGRCAVSRGTDATWSLDQASCTGYSYEWCAATCFD